MKPVFSIHPDVLAVNPSIREYRNLTSWFLHRKTEGQYNKTFIDHEVFKVNYLDSLRPWERDRDILYPKFTTLNLECHRIDWTNHTMWDEWCDQYIGVMRQMRTTGRQVACYGLDAGSAQFQAYFNLYRHLYANGDWHRAQPFIEKAFVSDQTAMRLGERFAPEVDISMSSAYLPYRVNSVDSWQMSAHLYYLERKWAMQKQAYPGKKHLIWVQPNHTSDGFYPMTFEVWQRLIDFANASIHCDGLMVFTLPGADLPPNWTKPFEVSA